MSEIQSYKSFIHMIYVSYCDRGIKTSKKELMEIYPKGCPEHLGGN
jgi:hypothetical protein